ncbi:hypothetical protein [Roseisolibacter sp. H3M3-2]|uniref:hypothetical protein n=1 Tax=Roseisolibacter sp. H3M3-2 TaxID=3031323 RepID=UPI0023DA3509|nr:hypothetical protein [Roseisolibacter sp. H3M3-2]MDF1503074.1 hypothetical protein [Roseisolibacter sp. H3M3-2]
MHTVASAWLLLAMQGPIHAPPPVPAQPPAPAEADALRADTRDAVRRFLERWRAAWLAAEDARRPNAFRLATGEARPAGAAGAAGAGAARRRRQYLFDRTIDRVSALHCHPFERSGPLFRSTIVRSAGGGQSLCPAWSDAGHPAPADEGSSLDAALAADARPAIASAREALLARLDTVALALPDDDWVAGQRVRFLLDAGETDRALDAARACRADAGWCALLAGYVHQRRGEARLADSAFDAGRAAMSDSLRCAWDDAAPLLAPPARAEYARLSCAERREVDARLWWLADPLYAEPGNERRAEHHARRVATRLRAALTRDERHEWDPGRGGDALAETLLRYGTPSYVFWGGETHDVAHTGWLRSHGLRPGAPYLALEYRPGEHRAHVVPAWRAVRDPFAARSADWSLRPAADADAASWWPEEHYARAGAPLVQLPDGQTAMLRRATAALFAVAAELPAATLRRAAGAPLAASLFVTHHPDSVWQLAHEPVVAGGRLVLQGRLEPRPALVAVELPGDTAGGVAARTRFGVAPPPPLSAMRAGETAVSEPVLLLAPDGDAALPDDPDAALPRMLGSTRLPRGLRRFGVYWETYGLAPGDTVDVEVRLERHDRPGALRRLTTTLGVTDPQNGVIVTRWREPQPGRAARVVDGPVPILARGLVLEVSRLPAGDYWLDVAVGRPGRPAARARRSLTLDE